MQTGEVSVNNRAMIPVPPYVASTSNFRCAMHWRQMHWCSVVSMDEESEWYQIEQKDGATLDMYAFMAKPAKETETLHAQFEKEKLSNEVLAATSSAQAASKDAARSVGPEVRAMLWRVVSSLPFLQQSRHTVVFDQCIATLTRLGITSESGCLTLLTDTDSCEALV